jgi:hypothetical protein
MAVDIATQLDHAPLREWVTHELNSYSDRDSVPDTDAWRGRKCSATLKACWARG